MPWLSCYEIITAVSLLVTQITIRVYQCLSRRLQQTIKGQRRIGSALEVSICGVERPPLGGALAQASGWENVTCESLVESSAGPHTGRGPSDRHALFSFNATHTGGGYSALLCSEFSRARESEQRGQQRPFSGSNVCCWWSVPLQSVSVGGEVLRSYPSWRSPQGRDLGVRAPYSSMLIIKIFFYLCIVFAFRVWTTFPQEYSRFTQARSTRGICTYSSVTEHHCTLSMTGKESKKE